MSQKAVVNVDCAN